MTVRARVLTLLPAILLLGCSDRIVPTAPETETCGPYPSAAASPYQLPIPVGDSTVLVQGNCSSFSHSGSNRYAFDFAMEPGRVVVAVRGGMVTALDESHVDNQENAIDEANFVEILHGDGTASFYAHLMQDGVLVELGETVSAGQPIGRVGLTGFTTGPHLHFEVTACEAGCDSIPVTFNNASPPDEGGLQAGRRYEAVQPGGGGLRIDGGSSSSDAPGAGPNPGISPRPELPARQRRSPIGPKI